MNDNKTPTPEETLAADAQERRAALAKLGKYAAAGYVAPAVLSLLVSRRASAASFVPPPPPP